MSSAMCPPKSDPKLGVFSPERFLVDIHKTSSIMDAPYSESCVRAVLKAYHQSFMEGAVLWRTTNRPGDALNFRFYERCPVDCIAIAVAAGFLPADDPLGHMITSLGSLYNGTPEQSCDFDAQTGLTKTWIFLGGKRPVDDILQAPNVPESVRCLGPTFHKLGLNIIRHVAVDYQSGTVNIYFRLPGPISEEQAFKLVGLVGSPSPSQGEMLQMCELLHPIAFSFAVTVKVTTGVVKRVAFYGHKMPPGGYTKFGERLTKFFKYAPSYDEEELNVVAWSFGIEAKKYLKAERSYCGQLMPLVRGWNSL